MSYVDIIIVAITLILFVILGFKIWQNKNLMRGTAKPKKIETTEDFMHGFVDQPELWVKLAKGISPISPEEDASMSLMVGAAFQAFNEQCHNYEKGELDDSEAQALKESVFRIYSMPGVKKYWGDIMPDMSPCMLQFINESEGSDS